VPIASQKKSGRGTQSPTALIKNDISVIIIFIIVIYYNDQLYMESI
jgi:hypothetical protein